MKRTNLQELPTECVGSFLFHMKQKILAFLGENEGYLKKTTSEFGVI